MGLAMTERDFVMAWLLASRMGGDDHWTSAKTFHLIENAKHVYKQLKEETHESDDGMHEM